MDERSLTELVAELLCDITVERQRVDALVSWSEDQDERNEGDRRTCSREERRLREEIERLDDALRAHEDDRRMHGNASS